MGILDGLMGQIEGSAAAEIAAKMGIDPSIAQTALAALAQAHPQPGDTVEAAAASSGLSPDLLNTVVGHLGGEGGLGALVGSLGGAVQPAGEGEAAAPAAGGGLGGIVGGLLGGLMGGNKS